MSKYSNVSVDSLLGNVNGALDEIKNHEKAIMDCKANYFFDTPVSKKIEDSLANITDYSLNGSTGNLKNKLNTLVTICDKIKDIKQKESYLRKVRNDKSNYKKETGADEEDEKVKEFNRLINNYQNQINRIEKEIDGLL